MSTPEYPELPTSPNSGCCAAQLEEAHRLAYENCKDIIACGFDMKKVTDTLAFEDTTTHMHAHARALTHAISLTLYHACTHAHRTKAS